MKILNNDSERKPLNLTPLIDVVFLLLIFFMVTTTFQKQAKLKIELPEADIEAVNSASQSLTISLSQNGEIYINSDKLLNNQRKTIAAALNEYADKSEQTPVVIRADANVAHKYVVRIMDVLGSMRFTSISMATTQSKDSE